MSFDDINLVSTFMILGLPAVAGLLLTLVGSYEQPLALLMAQPRQPERHPTTAAPVTRTTAAAPRAAVR